MKSIRVFLVILMLLVSAASATDEGTADVVPEPSGDELRSAEARQDVLSADNRSIDGLEIVVRTDGILKVDLRGRFQHALAVRIEDDGSSTIECLDDADAMAAFLAAVVEESARRPHETAEK